MFYDQYQMPAYLMQGIAGALHTKVYKINNGELKSREQWTRYENGLNFFSTGYVENLSLVKRKIIKGKLKNALEYPHYFTM